MRQDVDLGVEALRPIIQVLLVAKLAVLLAAVTPLETALLPPAQYLLSLWRVAESHELHAEPAVAHVMRMLGREGVLGDQDVLSRLRKLVEQDARWLEEEEIRIEVGHAPDARRALKHGARQERRQGPAVLGHRTVLLHRAQRCALHLCEPQHCGVTGLHLLERLGARVVERDDPKMKRSGVFLERAM